MFGILGLGCGGCRGIKGRGILQGTQHKVSDWREASRGAKVLPASQGEEEGQNDDKTL